MPIMMPMPLTNHCSHLHPVCGRAAGLLPVSVGGRGADRRRPQSRLVLRAGGGRRPAAHVEAAGPAAGGLGPGLGLRSHHHGSHRVQVRSTQEIRPL